MNIGFVYDLRSSYITEGYSEEDVAEFDSQSTIDALTEAMQKSGHSVEHVGHGRNLAQRLASGARWDLVFTIAEGLYGRSREAQVPCLLEMFGVPCTFSDPLVCAATLDKAVAKRLIASFDLPTPRFAVIRKEADLDGVDLRADLLTIEGHAGFEAQRVARRQPNRQ